jgi:hypothetical protein
LILAILVNVEPDEIEQTLIKTARLVEENNKILRRMQRAQRTAAFIRFLQWIVILGSFAVLYYLIQPYIAEIKVLTETYRTMLDSGRDSVRYEALENFLDGFDLSEEGSGAPAEMSTEGDPETGGIIESPEEEEVTEITQ